MIIPVQGAQAVTRALHVLRAVARTRVVGITLAQLVRETKLNKPTAHRLLLALIAEGMVEQEPDSLRYFVGHECYALGSVANERFGYGRIASDGVARLAQLSGDSAFFSIRSDVFAACVLREDGDYPLKTHVLQPGTRHPLGVGAGSLAILAALNDVEIERCLAVNADVLAIKHPQCSPAMLRELVDITRERGYSINEGLIASGSWGLGTAVYSPKGDVVGAFSIAAVEAHLQTARQQELAPYVIAEARLLEAHLKQLETVRPDNFEARGRTSM